jgi:hypothetical protein
MEAVAGSHSWTLASGREGYWFGCPEMWFLSIIEVGCKEDFA